MNGSGDNAYITYTMTDDNGKTLYIKHKFIKDDGKIYTRSSYDQEWTEAGNEYYNMMFGYVSKNIPGCS